MKIEKTFKKLKGFTLLEILVVLVIISVVATMGMLTIGYNDHKKIEAFAKDLTETITLAEEQALLQPTNLNLVFTKKTFGFYQSLKGKDTSDLKIVSDQELGLHPI